MRLEILDAVGKQVQSLTVKKEEPQTKEIDPDAPDEAYKKPALTNKPGLNRISWDLRYAGAKFIPKAKNDGGNPKRGPLVNPGTYTLKLTVDGKTQTTSLEVKPDPRVKTGEKILDEQLRFTLKLRDDISKLSGMVIRLRQIRTQLNERGTLLKKDPNAEALIKKARALIEKIDVLEGKLHNPKAEVTYDILGQGARLYSKLTSLYEWAQDSDGPITQGMREVAGAYDAELTALSHDYGTVLSELAEWNRESRDANIPNILVPGE
jgi:hypothetical protein